MAGEPTAPRFHMEKGRERETPSAGRTDQSPATASLPHRLTAAGLLVSPHAAPSKDAIPTQC